MNKPALQSALQEVNAILQGAGAGSAATIGAFTIYLSSHSSEAFIQFGGASGAANFVPNVRLARKVSMQLKYSEQTLQDLEARIAAWLKQPVVFSLDREQIDITYLQDLLSRGADRHAAGHFKYTDASVEEYADHAEAFGDYIGSLQDARMMLEGRSGEVLCISLDGQGEYGFWLDGSYGLESLVFAEVPAGGFPSYIAPGGYQIGVGIEVSSAVSPAGLRLLGGALRRGIAGRSVRSFGHLPARS